MRAMRLVAALTLLLLASCSSFSERWATASFSNISYGALFSTVVNTLGNEGYSVRDVDAQTAKVQSEWVYGTSQRQVRGPSRRKAHAEFTPLGEREFQVRIRVEEQVIRKGGMLATQVRESDDWEAYEDNYDDADYLIAKVAALLDANRSREAQP
jgi:hypothetical protein